MNNHSSVKSKELFSIREFLIKYNPLLILLGLIIISSILSPYFLTVQNTFNVLKQQVVYSLIAMGVMLTLMSGGIDLSVASTAGISGVIVPIVLTNWGMDGAGGFIFAILFAIFIGCLIGAINGFLIGVLKMQAFITTLAMMTVGEGIAFMLTNGNQVQLYDTNAASAALIWFGRAKDPLIGMPLLVYFAIIIVLIFVFVMKYTPFGRLILAVGSNESAVKLAGINVTKYKFIVYIISGALAAIAGIIITARTSIGAPTVSTSDYALSTVAACIIGGVALEGGKGTVAFTVVGVFILALITNIMNLIGIASYPQNVVKGLIIIIAIFIRKLGDKNHI